MSISIAASASSWFPSSSTPSTKTLSEHSKLLCSNRYCFLPHLLLFWSFKKSDLEEWHSCLLPSLVSVAFTTHSWCGLLTQHCLALRPFMSQSQEKPWELCFPMDATVLAGCLAVLRKRREACHPRQSIRECPLRTAHVSK